MLIFYFAPGSSAMATHIALHETGAAFEPRLLSFANKEQQRPDYLALNPEGKVPALLIDGQVLTEVAATLYYLLTGKPPFFGANTAATLARIVTDPPPPVEAAGSSLLYSEEFYALVKQHLKPNGIIQVWFPGGETKTGQAILRSLQESFPYTQCFRGIKRHGVHILASMQPLRNLTTEQVASVMPPAAASDL